MTRSADRAEAVRIVANVPGELGHVDIALSIEREVRWTLRIGPLLEEFTIRAEYLNTVDFAVTHEHASIRGDRESVRQPELAGAIAGLTPRALQLPARGEHVHACIAIAVRDVDVALWADGDVGRTVERQASALDRAGGLAVIARVRQYVEGGHRHQQSALWCKLTNRVVAVIRSEDGAIGGDIDTVRAHGEVALAPRAKEIALAVVDDHGVLSAADQKHTIFPIHCDAGHVPMCKALGQLLPALDHLVLHLIAHKIGRAHV